MTLSRTRTLLALAALALAMPASALATPTITVDLDNEIGTLTPELLGINHPASMIYYQAGFDTTTGQFHPNFYAGLEPIGLQSWRYPGGTESGSYYWWHSLGDYPRPAGFRKPYYLCSGGQNAPHYYYFGFMDLMDFLADINAATVNICLNFGTDPEAAKRAADWVEFANAEVGADPNGDGVDWAALRDSLGHADPYGIRYWELGNELGSVYGSHYYYHNAWSWHYGLQPGQYSGEDREQRRRNYLLGGEQWQFRDICAEGAHPYQLVVQPRDWSVPASQSNGLAGQTFHIKYPPANPDTTAMALFTSDQIGQTGPAWHWVEDLSHWGPADSVYTFDPVSGLIAFGDDVNGAIPPVDSYIGVQYQAVNKDGLVDFYREMKRVDPEIRLSSSFFADAFLATVQEAALDTLPFDGISIHPYLEGEEHDVEAEHWRLQQITAALADDLVARSSRLDSLFGTERELELMICEFNVVYMIDYVNSSCPNPTRHGEKLPYFGKSLSQTLALANGMLEMIRLSEEARIRVLNIHSLLPFAPEPLTPCGWDMTALLGVDGVDTYLNSSGLFFSLLSPQVGDNLVEVSLADCPVLEHTYEDSIPISLPYLNAWAMPGPYAESAAVFVLNRASDLPGSAELHSEITTEVQFLNDPGFTELEIYELNADSLWNYNSPTTPGAVQIVQHPNMLFTPVLEYTFPPHSLTLLVALRDLSAAGGERRTSSAAALRSWPNPAGARSQIRFELARSGSIRLGIYNLAGRHVRTLRQGALPAGSHSLEWDGRDDRGRRLAAGTYICRMEDKRRVFTRKILLLK